MKNLLEKLQVAKILENLKSDKKKLFLTVLLGVTFLFVDFRFIISGQVSTLKRLGPKITKLRSDMDKLNKDLSEMRTLKDKEIQQPEAKLKAKRIISMEEVASLLQDISNSATKHDVKITKLQASKEALSLKSDRQAAAEMKTMPLLISLELFGAYHNLGKFLNELENREVFVVVQNMKILPQTADFLKQKISLELKTYVRK